MHFQHKGERTPEARARLHSREFGTLPSNTCPTILERQLNNINIRFQHFMMENPGEEMSELTPEIQEYKIYRRRWYILIVFSAMSCMQYLVWNTFGPIVSSIQYAFEWSDSTLAMMPNWGTITLVLGVFPMCWLLEQKGLKFSIVTASLLVAIGAVLRGITQEEYLFKVLSHLGSISNGIAGITVMSVPPALSATWFPPGERTLATFFGQVATQLGTGLSFALGPWLVPGKNLTDNVNEVKGQIYRYLWIEAGAAIGLFLLILLYFPKQPPSPPSASASLPRTDFQEGIKGLIKNKNALLCTVAYGLSGGTFLAWQSVMTLNFQSVGISDKESGRIGLVICAASFISGGIFAYGTDHLKKHMKTTLIILLMLEALSFFWLTLIISQVIAYSSWQLWVSSVAGSAFTFSLAPLFFEYTVELTYPAPEGLVGGLLAGFYNLVGTIFLSLFFAQNIGHLWVNYALVIAAIVSIPFVILTKETYRRLEVDVPATTPILHENSNTPYYVLP